MNIKQDINMTRKPTDIETKYDLRDIRKNKEELSNVSKSVSVLDTTKQSKLISGVNIKTINHQSILGSGNIDFLNLIYPVGSIYMSVNDANPGTLFGGVWEQIKDTFLLACGDIYSNGTTGGEAEHILTVNEMPSHRHDNKIDATDKPNWNNRIQYTTADSLLHDEAYKYRTAGTNYRIENSPTTLVGGGEAHNNMPPYLAVNIWKRIA